MEIRIRNSIWLLCCSYNPSKLQIASHIQEISNGTDAYCKKYENMLIMGDFNVDVKEASLHLFCNQYKLKSLNKDPTCYKNIDIPSCKELLQRAWKVLVLLKRAFQISINLSSRYLMRSTNGCLRKLHSTDIRKSLLTQLSTIIFANKQKN